MSHRLQRQLYRRVEAGSGSVADLPCTALRGRARWGVLSIKTEQSIDLERRGIEHDVLAPAGDDALLAVAQRLAQLHTQVRRLSSAVSSVASPHKSVASLRRGWRPFGDRAERRAARARASWAAASRHRGARCALRDPRDPWEGRRENSTLRSCSMRRFTRYQEASASLSGMRRVKR